MVRSENPTEYLLTAEEYEEIQDRLCWLHCLEAAGVDNWEGTDYAQELMAEEKEPL